MKIHSDRKPGSTDRAVKFAFMEEAPGEMLEAWHRLHVMDHFGRLPAGCGFDPAGMDAAGGEISLKMKESEARFLFHNAGHDDEVRPGHRRTFWEWVDADGGKFPERLPAGEWRDRMHRYAEGGSVRNALCEGRKVWVDFDGNSGRYSSGGPTMRGIGDWNIMSSVSEAEAVRDLINIAATAWKAREGDYGTLLSAVRDAAGGDYGGVWIHGDSCCREVEVTVRVFPERERDACGKRDEFAIAFGDGLDGPVIEEGPAEGAPGRILVPRPRDMATGGDFDRAVADAVSAYMERFFAPRPVGGRPHLDEDERVVDDYLTHCRRGGGGEVDWDVFLGYMRAELGDDADAYLELSRRKEGDGA